MVIFENVTKKYGNTLALDNVNFNIGQGEFIFLVGESGAGKTTILRLIIKDITPTKGIVKIENINISKLSDAKIPQLRRKVGMIFQDFKMLTDRTITENVSVALEILNKNHLEIDRITKEVLSKVGLITKRNLFPVQLSAGELQRAAIARAIIGKPDILLADEPTGNLDPKTGWDILKILNDISRDGTTVIMATHNVDIVNSMDKRVITLSKGKIVKDELKGKYKK